MNPAEAINLALAIANGLGKAFEEVWAIFRAQRPELKDEDIPNAAAAYARAREIALAPLAPPEKP